MRRLEFDQFEFPNASTEEHLVVTLEERGRSPSKDIRSFVARCDEGTRLSEELNGAAMLPLAASHVRFLDYLETFAQVPKTEIRQARVARLSWEEDEETAVVETPRFFVLFRWSASA